MPLLPTAQAAALFLPVVVRGLVDAHLSAYLGDGDARVGLAQSEYDLGCRELGLF